MSTRILPAVQMLGFGLLAVVIKIVLPMGDFTLFAGEMVALLLALCGLVLLAISGALFKQYNTTISPVHPDKASTLVIYGLYRLSRNPMYLGFLSLLVAWTFYLGSAYALLVSPLFIATLNRFNIFPEEQALDARFGEAYNAYKKRVRHWI
jgi:protein-S-isoprenylcysteine O-methyltransferase Ste14